MKTPMNFQARTVSEVGTSRAARSTSGKLNDMGRRTEAPFDGKLFLWTQKAQYGLVKVYIALNYIGIPNLI